ncbi:MAG: M24 family metallopeptidase, partial [Verrucomicrobia bacterium]|nr:M24 family metallopeptidase [Verrucomicrobiota bacterium]
RPGGEIYAAGLAAVAECEHRDKITFQAHGMGLVAHEMPHLTDKGDHPYPGTHIQKPLEAGMVISIETSVKDPEVGFVKIEDTVAVTDSGWEGYGDWGRGWNEVPA